MKKNYSFSLYFLIFFLVWAVRATWCYETVDQSIADDAWSLVFSNAIKLFFWVLPAVFLLVQFDRANPLVILGLKTNITAQNLAIVSGISILYFVLIFGLEFLISGRTLQPMLEAPPQELLGQLAAVFFSPIVEEALFRGFIQYKLEERYSFWTSNLIQAILFTLIHLPNWLWVNSFTPQVVNLAVAVFIFAIFAGWVRRKSASIYPPIVVHILNNFLSSFVG